MKPKNILLYVDASKESRAALDVAVDYSGPETTIIAVNVVNRQTVIQLTRSGEISLAEAEVELEENGWCYLYDAEEIAKSAGASIVILQESGYPEEVLPRLASEYGVDLIIIGHTPGLGQASLAQQLIEHAPCAVLVVK
ncbi:universal stress protein [bacterium]|nr:universal stress protein [bacterium]MBR5945491.1 universal stress protein [bacterium]